MVYFLVPFYDFYCLCYYHIIYLFIYHLDIILDII